MYGGNRPLGGFGQGWQGGNRGGRNNNRGGYGNPMYGNRGGMRPQGWGGMGGYGGMGGNQGGGWGNAWGQPQNMGGNMGGYGRMPNQMQPNQGMNYANAVKNENVKQEPANGNKPNAAPGVRPPAPGKQNGEPQKKKLRLEQMGFGNMGSGFGCSLFVPNQGEEMPTMLQMGYAGEAPGMGFGDEPEVKQEVKTEPKAEAKPGDLEPKPTLGKVGKVGGEMSSVNQEKKAEWPPALMDYISRAFSSCRNDQEKDKTEKYLKNILNGRLKSGSAYEIDWENEPLPKDIFTDKNKDQKSKDINKSRDCMFNPNLEQQEETEYRGVHDLTVRKQTKSEKKKKKIDQFNNLNPDVNFEIEDPMSGLKKAARHMRFQSDQAERAKQKRQVPLSLQLVDGAPRSFDPMKMKIIGTSTALFKPFLRLTTAPEAWEVRTRQQLPISFRAVIKKWKEEHNYKWTCEQLKSIRQDLTVQGIRDEFMIEVYESHARIAIEASDHAEFNQCQSQLAQLYKDGRKSENQAEFAAYSIIYCLYTKNMTDMTKRLSQLSEDMAKDSLISDALKLRSHLSLGNYLGFFRIYKRSSTHMKLLVGKFIERERRKAISTIVKGLVDLQGRQPFFFNNTLWCEHSRMHPSKLLPPMTCDPFRSPQYGQKAILGLG